VTRTRSFARYWLPAIAWMIIIFSASTDVMSSQHTSRIIGPILRWMFPSISEETVSRVQLVIRKCGHLSEYAVLAGLLWRAWRKPVRNDPRPWRWKDAGVALLMAAAYSASDEIHQLFVPSRQGQIVDVLIDTSGAVLGLLAVWVIGRWRKAW